MDKEKLTLVALEEIRNRTFELTKQYLENNTLILEGDTPRIEDIIISDDNLTAEVDFPVLNEPFFLVIYLDIEPEIEVRWVSMSAGNKVELFVSSESVALNSFIELLQINPKEKWSIGENRIIDGLRDCPPHKDYGFIYAPIDKTNGEVENKLENLLNELLKKKEIILELEKVAIVEIQVTYFGYKDEMWGFNFKPHIIQMLSEIGVSLDIDLYACGNDLYKVDD